MIWRPRLALEILAAWLAGHLAAAGAEAQAQAQAQAVPVRGGHLSLEVEASGGKLRLSAGRFWELRDRGAEAGGDECRRFVAGELTVRVEGVQRGEYVLLPEGDGQWHERTAAELRLDEESAWALSAADAVKEARELWHGVPLRMEMRASGEGAWSLYLDTRDLVLPGGCGEVKKHHSRSTMIETVQRDHWVDGQRRAAPAVQRSRPCPVPLSVRVGREGQTEARWHSNLSPPELSFGWGEPLPLAVEGPGKMRGSGELKQISLARLAPSSEGGFGGTQVRFAWEFRLGAPPDAGWWEPLDPGLETWMPSFGDALRFRVTLNRLEAVQGVRFLWQEVSEHPGVAVNAGHGHLRGTAAAAPGKGEVPLEWKEGGAALAWKRHYPVAASVPRDCFADLYFEQARNPLGLVGGDSLTEPDGVRMGTELRFEKLAKEIEAVATVADWGAAGVIGVEALIDGVWEPLRAKGPGLQADEVSLRLPVDGNADGIPDSFAPGGPGTDDGDGLDLLEEYRGVLAEGRLIRLNPTRKDVFLIDYAQLLGEEARREVESGLAAQGVAVHWLGMAEHRGERVGKRGEVLVLEHLGAHALPLILRTEDAQTQTGAWKAIRPRPGARTVFLDEKTEARWVAGDLRLALDAPAKGGGK